MGLLKIFKGGIKLGAGLKPKGDFPLMEAYDIVVDEDGTRLDGVLFDESGTRLDKKVKSITERNTTADASLEGIKTSLDNANLILQGLEADVKSLKENPSGGSVNITYDSVNESLTIKQEEQQK